MKGEGTELDLDTPAPSALQVYKLRHDKRTLTVQIYLEMDDNLLF